MISVISCAEGTDCALDVCGSKPTGVPFGCVIMTFMCRTGVRIMIRSAQLSVCNEGAQGCSFKGEVLWKNSGDIFHASRASLLSLAEYVCWACCVLVISHHSSYMRGIEIS